MKTRGIRNNNPLNACSIAAAQSDSSLKAAQADRSPQRTSLTLASVGGPRGIRNNNPLNIRFNASNNWRGRRVAADGQPCGKRDKDFEEFISMDYGFLAALNLIGNTYMHRLHLCTPSAIIARWAPPRVRRSDRTKSSSGELKTTDPSAPPQKLKFSGTPDEEWVFENDTDGYIKTVCSMTGIGGEERLSNHDTKLRELVWAMAHVESGKGIEQYREDLEKAWAVYKPKNGKCKM